ncbi:MAG: DbpA RNA binding domain-containing protein [Treponema sp.]|nr:DbpA RNA binding domain-containing protein [Treponema sp.]
MALHINREKTKKTIDLILDKIREESDQALLAEYHSLFTKEVSLFHRSKVAAYLLMMYDQAAGVPGKDLRSALGSRAHAPAADTRGRDTQDSASDGPPRNLIPEEESKRLFFSVGRSRRVFPREIIGLITTKTTVSKEDIGAIRILDSYSFVQVRDTVAEQLIESLNGLKVRGRALTVNYAKWRRDSEDSDDDDMFDSEQNQDHSEEEDI